MLVIVGSVIVIASVIGGYLMAGGDLNVLVQPSEFVVIGGAGLGDRCARYRSGAEHRRCGSVAGRDALGGRCRGPARADRAAARLERSGALRLSARIGGVGGADPGQPARVRANARRAGARAPGSPRARIRE